MLTLWAHSIVTTVAPIEFTHSRHRRLAHQVDNWAHFAGKALNDSAKKAFFQHMVVAKTSGEPQQRRPRPARRARRKSVRDLFHRDFCAARMAAGQGVRLCEAAFWEAERAAFEDLAPEALAQYELEAAAQRDLPPPPPFAEAAPLPPAPAASPGLLVGAARKAARSQPAVLPADLAMLPAMPDGRIVVDRVEDLVAPLEPGTDLPLAESQLAHGLQGSTGQRLSLEKAYTGFVREQLHVASGDAVGEVHYPRRGRSQPLPTSASARRFHRSLSKALCELAMTRGPGWCLGGGGGVELTAPFGDHRAAVPE